MYGGILVPPYIKATIASFFENKETSTIENLLNVLVDEEDALQYIYALIFQNDLFVDMGVAISEKSKLSYK